MSDPIRYAWGTSGLGAFIAAASDHGLVAFEFGDWHTAQLEALQRRCPGAILIEDAAGLAETIAKLAALVEHPERDPGLALDIRGSAFEKRVWDALRDVPAGQTASYGDIAVKLGTPRQAREVAEACAANTLAILIPCHRVVKRDGALSGYRWGAKRKRALLAREQNATAFQLV